MFDKEKENEVMAGADILWRLIVRLQIPSK